MKQEYVLLRTENDLLNSLIGQSFNQRTKLEAYKILTEIHSKAQDRSIGKMALCYIVDKNEIKGVGGSTLLKDKRTKVIISNLILDQFGILLAGMFKGGTAIKSVVINDINNFASTLVVNSASLVNFNERNDITTLVQVGSGSTPPARTDFFVETIFGTAPEASAIATAIPVFNSGLGNFKVTGSINAGGAGTINESILRPNWQDSGSVFRSFTLFRDIISPAQSFIAGQTIALEYTVQL